MKKRDSVEEALDRLSVLRTEPESPAMVEEIRSFLGNKVNLIVAKAAKRAGEFRMDGLIPNLVGAFDRLMANPTKLDKGCFATTEIVGALYAMEYGGPEVYLKGIRHVQMEASFGPPVDVAVHLRSASALGLVQTLHPDAVFEVVRLMVDREGGARIGAVRALALIPGDTGLLLLRFKVLVGDPEPEVIGECFTGMLALSPERSLPFVAKYLDDEDLAISEAAILALGASRCIDALEMLKEKWGRTVGGGAIRKTLLLALATARHEAALEFLLSLLEAESTKSAADVIAALRVYRNDDRVTKSIEEIVLRRGDQRLIDVFRTELRGRPG